jgi:exopolysaccharide biosynthesis polyprenyl glycosylphosphotransferase
VTKLFAAIVIAPVIFGWHVSFPAGGPQVLIGALLVTVAFLTVRRITRDRRDKSGRVLILGSGPLADSVIEDIESAGEQRYCVAGTVDDQMPVAGSPERARWLGTSDQLTEIVEHVHPAIIVVAVADRRERLPLRSLLESRVRGVVVEDALEFSERVMGKIAIETLRPNMLIMGKGFRNHGAADLTARAVSCAGAAVGLVLCAPLLVAIGIAVKIDSRGPMFFIQQRSGKNGRPFGLLKFRTMRPCSEPTSEWVSDNVDRITRIGHYLRRFRLDELPQLVNVLRGDMKLVGPRPHPVTNQAVFKEKIAYYEIRSTVHPGVTGWAQIRYGYANNLDEETEKMRYDLYYIKNRSLWLDVRIMLETVATVLFGKGATEVRRRRAPLRPTVAWPSTHRAALAATGTDGRRQYVSWMSAPAPTAARTSAGQQRIRPRL